MSAYVNRYLNTEDMLELAVRFLNRLSALLATFPFAANPTERLLGAGSLLPCIATVVSEAVAGLRQAALALTSARTALLKARASRDERVADGYAALKVIYADAEAGAGRLALSSRVHPEQVLAALFPAGPPSAIRQRLSDLAMAFARAQASIDKYPGVLSDAGRGELADWNRLLETELTTQYAAGTGLAEARRNVHSARRRLETTWKMAKLMLDGLAVVYDIPDSVLSELFLDRDRRWLAARTVGQPEEETDGMAELSGDETGTEELQSESMVVPGNGSSRPEAESHAQP